MYLDDMYLDVYFVKTKFQIHKICDIGDATFFFKKSYILYPA